MSYDVIIVGGSYAGMSAGLQLARARRKIAIVDSGQRRNRFASSSHGFLSQDGRAPGDIAADARAQLLTYQTVEWIEGEASGAGGRAGDFRIRLTDGRDLNTKVLVLAPGVIACGDAARGAGSVALAVGDGAMAGAMAHRSLIFP